jgi:hypothetical protein
LLKGVKVAVVSDKPLKFIAPDGVAVRFIIRMEYCSSVERQRVVRLSVVLADVSLRGTYEEAGSG